MQAKLVNVDIVTRTKPIITFLVARSICFGAKLLEAVSSLLCSALPTSLIRETYLLRDIVGCRSGTTFIVDHLIQLVLRFFKYRLHIIISNSETNCDITSKEDLYLSILQRTTAQLPSCEFQYTTTSDRNYQSPSKAFETHNQDPKNGRNTSNYEPCKKE